MVKDKVHNVDLLIIGTGSGLDVITNQTSIAVVEKGETGGTCLTRGCIPSKIVIHAADVAQEIQNAQKFGLKAKLNSVDFKAITGRATHKVMSSSKGIEQNLKSSKNIKFFKGEASFIGDKTVKVNDDIIKAKQVVIATGARPYIPNILGLETVPYWTSTEALRATKQPKSMIVLGGGYIGTELAHFYGGLGTDVIVVNRGEHLLSREDTETAERFTEAFSKKYTTVLNATAERVWKKGKMIFVEVKQKNKKKILKAETLLLAVGVTPNTDMLNLQNTAVKTSNKGYIIVNNQLETTSKNIWALGDVIGTFMLKHSANYEAEVVSHNLKGKNMKTDYKAMPYAIFSNPQVAGVGSTEEELQEKGIKYVKGEKKYMQTGMGLALQDENGFAKLLVDPKTRKILGCRVMGEQASIVIHEVIVAMRNDLTVDQLMDTIHIHPALSEVIQRAAWNIDWDNEN